MKSYLHGKKCYLSGPIQYDSTNRNWRIEPTEILSKEFGIVVFDPFADPKQQWLPILKKAQEEKDYETMRRVAKKFVRKDLSELDHSHLIIANLPLKVPTTGTHHEIINANDRKKPTLLVCEQGKENIPLWYYGFIPHEFMFGSWDELYKFLREVDAGVHMSNDRFWRIHDLI